VSTAAVFDSLNPLDLSFLDMAVFAEAPHILKPVDFVWNQEKAEDAGVQAEPAPANNTEQDPTLTPRAWWKPNPERTRAVGIQEGISSLREVLQQNRFDVSSGAASLRTRQILNTVCSVIGCLRIQVKLWFVGVRIRS
jgi:hypothetical protein